MVQFLQNKKAVKIKHQTGAKNQDFSKYPQLFS